MEKNNTSKNLEGYLKKLETIVENNAEEYCNVSRMDYDFRKSKLTMDILRLRKEGGEGFTKITHYLVEFLGVSIFSVIEDSDFDLSGYKVAQYLDCFMLRSKGEKIKIKATSENNRDYLEGRLQKLLCNVVIEIEVDLILLKAKKIRINNDEFMLE